MYGLLRPGDFRALGEAVEGVISSPGASSPLSKENIALLISALSLLISLGSYFLYRKEIGLTRQQMDEARKEREKQSLRASIYRVRKQEHIPEHPLQWLGAWVSVENKSADTLFLQDVRVAIGFRKLLAHARFNGVISYLSEMLAPSVNGIDFTLYTATIGIYGLPPLTRDLYENFYMIDWETRQPVYTDPLHEYRLRPQGERKIFYVFGIIPEEVSKKLADGGFYLYDIQLTLVFDQKEITLKENFFRGQWANDLPLDNEFTRYTFPFELKSPGITFFNPLDR